MPKPGSLPAITAVIGALTFATFSSSARAEDEPAAAGPCVRTEFKTELVKAACAKGGQKEAKDVMKKFAKDNKIKSCNQCHAKLAPKYDLKDDALAQFQKLGGK